MYVAQGVEQHASKVVQMDALVVVQVVLTANKKERARVLFCTFHFT